MESKSKNNPGRDKRHTVLSLCVQVLLVPVGWLVLQRGSRLPEQGLALLFYFLPIAFISGGLILLAFRASNKAVRAWFLYNFVGTGNLVYATTALVLMIFLHPDKTTIIPALLSLIIGYSILRDIFSEKKQ